MSKTKKLELSGDLITPAMPLRDSEVNHMRRLLAWLRCEYMLDEDMQRGYLSGHHELLRAGLTTQEEVDASVQRAAGRINQVPAYVRQAVKMLTKALRDHEQKSGIVDVEAQK